MDNSYEFIRIGDDIIPVLGARAEERAAKLLTKHHLRMAQVWHADDGRFLDRAVRTKRFIYAYQPVSKRKKR